MISLAYGARTFKMKFGHRGGNHPVKCLATGRIEITSQNHSYAVDPRRSRHALRMTHVNLLDDTVEGRGVPRRTWFSRCSTTPRALRVRRTAPICSISSFK